MSMLAVEDLAFGYGAVTVGSGVSFRLGEGETLALLGPNGSGKTTLFRTILGLLPSLAGRVLVDGPGDTARWRPAARARVFGYVPQASAGYFPFTVREVVLMGRTARLGAFSTPSAKDREVAGEALARIRIAHLAGREYTRISGGECQLVLIARALAQEPRILVLDEPTASLDFGNQVLVLDTIRRLAETGLAVVLSTHHPEQAFACADRAALLKAGRLMGLGPTTEALTDESLSDVYGVPLKVREIDGWTSCVPG